MIETNSQSDIVMLGTFGAWNLGTLQSRALPYARQLQLQGYRISIVTTPWDMSHEGGCLDTLSGVQIINSSAASARNPVMAVKQQMRWVNQLNPQIVHLFKPRGFGGLSAQLISRKRSFLLDIDDWEGDGGWNESGQYGSANRRMFEWQEQSLIANAASVSAASTLLVERARRLRQSMPTTTVFLPNGLENEWANDLGNIRKKTEFRTRPARVLFYSRFTEFSTDWIDGFCKVLAEINRMPINVLVIGHLPEGTVLSSVYKNVTVTPVGYARRKELPSLLQSASLAVYPYEDSLITRSKQSVKLLELMAAGCPVVASDVGDIRVTLRKSGIVIRSSDPGMYAQAVSLLLAQPAKLADMSIAAIERIKNHYTFTKLAPLLIDFYRMSGLKSSD